MEGPRVPGSAGLRHAQPETLGSSFVVLERFSFRVMGF